MLWDEASTVIQAHQHSRRRPSRLDAVKVDSLKEDPWEGAHPVDCHVVQARGVGPLADIENRLVHSNALGLVYSDCTRQASHRAGSSNQAKPRVCFGTIAEFGQLCGVDFQRWCLVERPPMSRHVTEDRSWMSTLGRHILVSSSADAESRPPGEGPRDNVVAGAVWGFIQGMQVDSGAGFPPTPPPAPLALGQAAADDITTFPTSSSRAF
ncbi:hypothetical protein N7519_000799 [Penicillium mononematosum]|uniref:uncharacterized protein n=1 Tax=Penicillium mononematosum TaxID=268346 RepID=UPI002547A6B8|nr:uncharacterized protein N7519_000799 [Penicillium mononematosum]KAJ6190778.1 hypothetical protein N7519_000799 [Penicillium mononematosum]